MDTDYAPSRRPLPFAELAKRTTSRASDLRLDDQPSAPPAAPPDPPALAPVVMAPYRPDIATDEQLNGMLPRAYRHVTGRSDGWTPQVRQAFLASLAADGSVQQAAKDVGRHFTSAYRLRARDAVFRAAWDAAVAMAYARLRDEAMERALNGVMVDRFRDGGFVGQERRYNDRLLMFMLDHLSRHGAVAAAGPADAFGMQFEKLLGETAPKRARRG